MLNSKEQLFGIAALVLSTGAVAALASAAPEALVGAGPTMSFQADAARMSGDEAAMYSLGLTFGGQLHHGASVPYSSNSGFGVELSFPKSSGGVADQP